MKTVAISLALGDLYAGAGLGPISVPFDGGIARFKALTAALNVHDETLIVCTAGHCKSAPRIPQPERELSLAGQLKQYVLENMPAWQCDLVTRPLCWGTRSEIRHGIKLAIREGFARADEPVTLMIASNLAHLPRVWVIAMRYKPRAWKLKLVRARHQFTFASHRTEPPKLILDLLHPQILKLRRKLGWLKRIVRGRSTGRRQAVHPSSKSTL